MKKTSKPGGSRTPAKKAPARKNSAKAKPRQGQGPAELLPILERLAESAERLARAAEQMAMAAARTPASAGREQQTEEVVGVVVVDEGEEE